MKVKPITIATIIISSFIASNTWAFGSVVSDPKSYTYYVKQLEQGLEQLEVAQEKLSVATDTYDKVTSVDKKISGNLQRASSHLEKIKDLQDLSSRDVSRSIRYATNALEQITDLPKYQEDVTDNIDSIFGTDQSKRNDWVSVEAEKKANRQKLMRQAIIDAETAQGKMDLQLENIEDLTQATNTAESLKDATDIGNTILLEMLENQRELINLVAGISKNIALANYEGGENADEKVNVIKNRDITNPDDWKYKSSNPKKNPDFKNCDLIKGGCVDKDMSDFFGGK